MLMGRYEEEMQIISTHQVFFLMYSLSFRNRKKIIWHSCLIDGDDGKISLSAFHIDINSIESRSGKRWWQCWACMRSLL